MHVNSRETKEKTKDDFLYEHDGIAFEGFVRDIAAYCSCIA